MYKLLENYKFIDEINLDISLKLLITDNPLINIQIATGFSLLYYTACVFRVKKTHAGLTRILLEKFDDINVFSTFSR